ncbi:predicted protein [Uncinocarpus reesii 1704]|uniref:CCCH zinc finger domain protein n=1 Tax=Uncinocarpus reesii (strain UAMH 1704) TaxID=336963 RepID=C4JX17_UNCRE|nr:uncharacterized protein UREG_06190 [Uncinocarpus reesii 1704]EEP81325.1 predicted protein [Uncinocarpus reesii 1704]
MSTLEIEPLLEIDLVCSRAAGVAALEVSCKAVLQGEACNGPTGFHSHKPMTRLLVYIQSNLFIVSRLALAPGCPNSIREAQEDPRKKYALGVEDIRNDLTKGKHRPEWIFSAYGPGKDAPRQLFGGPEREQSFEEMRAIHYAAAASGSTEKAIQDANNLFAVCEAQIKTALADIDGAIKYIIDGENQHPNRIDITEGTTAAVPSQQSPFGVPTTSAPTSAFGQPTAFSQPTQGASFGRPSALGQQQQPQPAFGPPAFAQPAFGQTAFGQPSALGKQQQLAFGAPAFGQPSALKPSPFAQPLSQAPVQPNPFNQTSNASPFTQLPNQGQPFGQAQSQAQVESPFGKPSTGGFGQPQTANNPFGQPSPARAAPSGFGEQLQSQAPFSQPSGFGSTPIATQPVSQAAPIPTAATSALGNKKDPSKLDPLPKLVGETRRAPATKRLLAWKGQPVQYIENEPCFQHPDDPTTLVHIYFPDGRPALESFGRSVSMPEEYTPEG